ncbi:MAG: 4Fe-4S binding protein [Bacteroidota bacterium]
MGLRIDKAKCDGCGRCVDICPGDLLMIDADEKSSIRNQADCWDCMACVKSCPKGALETRLPFSLADFGATLKPEMFPDRIEWKLTYADSRLEEFIIPRS